MNSISYKNVDFAKIYVDGPTTSQRTTTAPNGKEVKVASYTVTVMYQYDKGPGKLKIISPKMISTGKGVHEHSQYPGKWQMFFRLDDDRCPVTDAFWHGENENDTETFWHKLYDRVTTLVQEKASEMKMRSDRVKFNSEHFPIFWGEKKDPTGLPEDGRTPFTKQKLIYRDYTDKKGNPATMKTEFYPAFAVKGQKTKAYKWKDLSNRAVMCQLVIDMSRIATAGPNIHYTRCVDRGVVYEVQETERSTGVEELQQEVSAAEFSARRAQVEKSRLDAKEDDDTDSMPSQREDMSDTD